MDRLFRVFPSEFWVMGCRDVWNWCPESQHMHMYHIFIHFFIFCMRWEVTVVRQAVAWQPTPPWQVASGDRNVYRRVGLTPSGLYSALQDWHEEKTTPLPAKYICVCEEIMCRAK